MTGAARYPRNQGFTLLELMIAVVVAGLLFFIALPGYRHMLLKSHRIAASGALLDVLSRQEQFFIDNRRYADSLAGLGLPLDYYVDAHAQQSPADRAVYKIELDLDQEGVYSGVRAVPRNVQAGDDQCMTLALSRLGVRSVTGTFSGASHRCW